MAAGALCCGQHSIEAGGDIQVLIGRFIPASYRANSMDLWEPDRGNDSLHRMVICSKPGILDTENDLNGLSPVTKVLAY